MRGARPAPRIQKLQTAVRGTQSDSQFPTASGAIVTQRLPTYKLVAWNEFRRVLREFRAANAY